MALTLSEPTASIRLTAAALLQSRRHCQIVKKSFLIAIASIEQ
jgi:hypothetical protein